MRTMPGTNETDDDETDDVDSGKAISNSADKLRGQEVREYQQLLYSRARVDQQLLLVMMRRNKWGALTHTSTPTTVLGC